MRVLLLCFVFCLSPVWAETLPFTPAPVPGGIAVIPLPESASPPRARYRGERVLVRRYGAAWHAIVGIPLATQPGTEYLELDGRRQAFTVQAKEYPEQRIALDNKRQVEPNAEDLARIAREQKLMGPAWRHWDETLQPELRLKQPTPGPLSSSFGLRRVFNGQARAPHSGLDIAAPQGTEVRAPASGTVLLTGDFFFNGNSVFLSHGQGLITLYCHLDQIAVKPGQSVRSGDLLGRVGKTGRATGPHLHWSVSLNNARIDPRLLLPGSLTPPTPSGQP